MRQLHPRFLQDPVYSGTLFREITIFPDKVSPWPLSSPVRSRRCVVEVAHWPVKTKDGFADLRYSPRIQTWSLSEFAKLLKQAVKAGNLGEKEHKQGPAELKSALFTIANEVVELSTIHIKGENTYLNAWPHHPLYKRGAFSSLVTAADQLDQIRKELSAAQRNVAQVAKQKK